MINIETVMLRALGMKGKKYVFGAEADPKNNNPDKLDCSELVQWDLNGLGVAMPDGSWNQYNYCKKRGTTISVASAINTYGALMFITSPGGAIHHVAFSLGNGRTFEAKGAAFGVGEFSVYNSAGRPRFDKAARIPDVDYSPHPQIPPALPAGLVGAINFIDGSGGWVLWKDGGITTWGRAPFYGSLPGLIQKGRANADPTRVATKLIQNVMGGYSILTNHPAEHFDFGPGVKY